MVVGFTPPANLNPVLLYIGVRSVYFPMPLTEGHYNLVLKGKWNGAQDIVNSFFFEMHLDGGTLVGDDAEYFGMAQRWWDFIKADLLAVTSATVVYKQIDVFKADGVDVGNSGFYTIPSGDGIGAQGGDPLPPFNAWTFQYTRPTSLFRHGYKRFAGVPESLTTNSEANGTALPFLDDLAESLNADVHIADGAVNVPFIEPALVQRVRNGIPVDPDVWYKPSTVQYKHIGSQNTRKNNRGS